MSHPNSRYRQRGLRVIDVFVSYATADQPRVKPLVDALQKQGWSVWWAHDILTGETPRVVIEEALGCARCVIVVWSRNSVESDWVHDEAEEAKRRKILVQVLLDVLQAPMGFRGKAPAKLLDWSGDLADAEFTKLVKGVSAVLASSSPQPLDSQDISGPMPSDAGTSVAHGPECVGTFLNRTAEQVGVAPRARFRPPSRRLLELPIPNTHQTLVAIAVSTALLVGILIYRMTAPFSPPDSPAALSTHSARVPPPSRPILPTRSTNDVPGVRKRENPKDGLTYVFIPPGKFMMGCSSRDGECKPDEKPSHDVQITQGFWMGQTEVTELAYSRFQYAKGKEAPAVRLEFPVVNVDWNAAHDYCDWAGLRLPTEAEWEYAARAGTIESRYGAIEDVAWYTKNSGGSRKATRKLKPNAWGIYDMLGNVWEWVADWYGDTSYQLTMGSDPVGPEHGLKKIIRGGYWSNYPESVRASSRDAYVPSFRSGNVGFRCVGELP